MNIVDKFRTGLKKTSVFLTSNISNSFTSNKVTPAMIENIETALISADISLDVANLLINKIKKSIIAEQTDTSFTLQLISKEITKILLESEKQLIESFEDFPDC